MRIMKKQKMIMLNGNMKRSSILIMLLMMMAMQSALAQQGENLVQNFSQGQNARLNLDSLFNSVGWGNKGDGFFNVDENALEKQSVWYDSITIKPNTTYMFSCMVANICENTIITELCINGKKVSKVNVSPYSNEWRSLSVKYTSGPDQTRIEASINWLAPPGSWTLWDSIVFKGIQAGEYKKAQSTCGGSLGSPIFFEDFGTPTTCYSSSPLSEGTTNYTFLNATNASNNSNDHRRPPEDGEYAIWCGSSAGKSFDMWHQTYYDHTTGTGSGTGSNMAIFNGSFTPGEFYRKPIAGLCPNTNYTFSIYVANMSKLENEVASCGYAGGLSIKPNLTFKIFKTGTTTLLASRNTGEIPLSSAFTWLYYDFSFNMGVETSVDVVLQNLAKGGCGNDLALDDISVRPCGPLLKASVSPDSIVNAGTSVAFNGTLGPGYTNPDFQWQSSTDGTTWTDIAGAASVNYTIPSTVITDSKQYRLLAAENGNLSNAKCRINSNVIPLTVAEIIPNVFFDTDKAELRQESKAALDKLYSMLKNKPGFFIQISGHTDNKASHEYNYVLSEARAVAVVQYLIDKGLDKNKLIAKGFGETRPIASNEGEAGRQRNRRIEFMILDPQEGSKYLSLQDSSIIRPGDERYNLLMNDFKAVYLKQQADKAPEAGKPLFYQVHFPSNQSKKITEYSASRLKSMLAYLEHYPDTKLKIVSHADFSGDEKYKLKLCAERAQTVYDYLIQNGLDRSSIRLCSAEEQTDVIRQDNKEGNQKAGLVEFLVE
jgi:outer membrane protein OmpA-like peptidoglycan-associated protein